MVETPDSGYGDHDRSRWVAEPPKRRSRGDFERDRARVLHSFALRRLAAKTQVAQPGASDFPRTRLTHSLECAQIGRELGAALGCDPDLVEAACLAHDLGHPPFGHNGEAALDAAARPCGGFEGNAQSLRLLTRLEAKVSAPGGRSAGLNLTRATLDATLKYPWPRGAGGDTRKFNAYADDADVFAWVRQGAPERRPCFEAQVMDWSDDVAYSVHDLEDGLYSGQIRLAALRSPVERARVCTTAAARYCDAEPAELEEVFEGLVAQDCWPDALTGDLPSLAALKNLTSELIGRFCRAAEQATRAAYGTARLTRYSAELVVPRRQRLECALLKAVTAHYVFPEDDSSRYARERRVVAELVEAVAAGAPHTLEPRFRADYAAARDDAAALRVVVDQVASLTDTSALAWHDRLC
ncbi:deoxyguanosinetriphosphate triphosphohydrolase [Thermobifida cellulosilytica]|uniref:Deoxyguanosinetriphosphate triphosphohydrolase n=1 Tax=Thermobifida cellulosilytica TB100 TaxID=665004 RepID=A0A147KD54_THECS|nr:deoxyguanosinetriphosphate triphosphohydrolase [Thermobifida cellulosilytica]KUP95231.1 deoxyguanosinetriphosphate triphosphohydrolase [Thermobifida cellulosilytica TB100]